MGCMAGGLLAGPIVQRLGPRSTIVYVVGPVLAASWLMVGLSNTILPILMGRVVAGMSHGMGEHFFHNF